MQIPYSNILNKRGEITVYLALIFLLFLGISFCVLEGAREYGASAAAQDAVKSAGENVMANYDREIFQNYHVFFLDPREKSYLEEDGKKYLDTYFKGGILKNSKCTSLGITEEKTAVDEDGLYLKHQIREWMKYRGKTQVEDLLKTLVENINKNDQKKEECLQETKSGEQEIQKAKEEAKAEESENGEAASGKETGKTGNEESQTDTETDEKTEKEKIRWKDIVETMKLMMKSGILFYAVDQPEKISVKSISGTALPSKKMGAGSGEDSFWNQSFTLSLSGLAEMTSLFSKKIELKTGKLWKEDYYLVPYIEDSFRCYEKEDAKEDSRETVLSYETEYIICGKSSDRENLKAVANRILMFRFITNYIYAANSPEIKKEAGLMAVAVTGFLGMPQAAKPAELIIIGALSYGESMLELHALLSGEEISVIKNDDTWNLKLETAVGQLKKKESVKKGRWNVSYEDFLKLLLLSKGDSGKVCYRMMDLMQENTALKEPGFLMQQSLFSWQWEGTVSIPKYFSYIPVFHLSSQSVMKVDFSRVNSY